MHGAPPRSVVCGDIDRRAGFKIAVRISLAFDRRRYRRLTTAASWLTAGHRGASKSSEAPAATLKFYTYRSALKKKHGGIPMIDHDKRYPTSPYAQRVQDVLLVSSFTMWAMVLGFAPVLTYRLLVS
jgi:hypothetical protein